MSEASTHFQIKLMPGETLHSIGDDDSPVGNFRTLSMEDDYDAPGKYRLQVELDDRPTPLTKTYIDFSLRSGSTIKELRDAQARETIDALGPISSNVATYAVSP